MTRTEYWEARVHKTHPGAYIYTAAKRRWLVNMLDDSSNVVTIGTGASRLEAWQNAAKRITTANAQSAASHADNSTKEKS